jgi:hypothetical protein
MVDPRGSGLLFFMFIRPHPYTCLGIECQGSAPTPVPATLHLSVPMPVVRITGLPVPPSNYDLRAQPHEEHTDRRLSYFLIWLPIKVFPIKCRIFPGKRSNTSNVLCSSCRATTTPGAPSVPPPSPDSRSMACALSHGTIAARGARPAAYQPALRIKFATKVRKRAQQRWSGLRLCALSSNCVLPSVTQCQCGPTLSRMPTRATRTRLRTRCNRARRC